MNILDTKPDKRSNRTRAWRINLQSETVPRPHGSTVIWIVHAPWAHPAWQSYMVGAVTLADVPGLPPSKKRFPEATHEIQVVALNPDKEIDIQKLGSLWLDPPNFIGQQAFKDDAECNEWVDARVEDILKERLSPDSDFRSAWALLLSKPQTQLLNVPPNTPIVH